MTHVLFSFIAFVFAIALGLIVLIKNQKNKVNRLFLLFSVLIGLMFFSDIFIRVADSSAQALPWAKAFGIFLILLPAVFLHFTTVFPKDRMFKDEYLKLLLYIPSLFFIMIGKLVEGVYFSHSFNPLLGGVAKWFAIYFVVYLLLAIRNFNVSLKEPDTDIRRMQAAYAIIGLSMFMFIAGLTDVVFPAFGKITFRSAVFFSIAMYGFITYSIHRHYLFVREPLAEECSAKEFQKYPLPLKSSLVIRDKSFHENFHVFLDQILHGKSGLCLTRTNPKKILEEYPLKRTPIMWLTELNVKDALNPADIEEIGYTVERFIGTAEKSVVYLDGVEYLTTYNSFLKTLHLIQDVKDKISLVNSNLLMPIKSGAFDEVQLRLIERELDRL
ncbi:MAG: DUF835 domain-containing protein [Nanoarchaeota archaeon]|nr:DUF835 domain-containing protein [Nanoarchaeota archaeon]